MDTLEQLFSEYTLNLNLLWYAVTIGIVLDFITGILKAYKSQGAVSSSKLRDGGFKKCGIILVSLLGYGLSLLFNDTHFVISNSILCYYTYTELVSIVENLNELGIPLPNIIKKIIGK